MISLGPWTKQTLLEVYGHRVVSAAQGAGLNLLRGSVSFSRCPAQRNGADFVAPEGVYAFVWELEYMFRPPLYIGPPAGAR